MRTRVSHLASALLVTAALGLAGTASAQQARIQGIVKDGQGHPLEGVKLTITTTASARFKLELTTDKNGKWGAILGNAVPPYTYKFEKSGYLASQETRKVSVGATEQFSTTLYTGEQAFAVGKAEIKKDPYVEAFNGAVEKFQAKDIPGALAMAEEATKLGPEKAGAWALTAAIERASKDWDKVIQHGEKALSLDAEQTDLYGLLAEAYRAKGNMAKAAEYEKKFATVNPDNPDILYNEAVDLYNKNNFKGAEPVLLKVLGVKPDHAKAHFLLGMSYVNLNKIPDMKTHLTEYLRLDPKGSDAAVAKEMLDAFK